MAHLQPQIVFPETSEFVLKKVPRNRALRLEKVLAVVYLFGGFSALVALLSKFVIEPLFQQLTIDRSTYTRLAARLLRDANIKLSNMISVQPKLNVERNGSSYVDAQTQTGQDDTKNNSQPKPLSSGLPGENDLGAKLNELSSEMELVETASTRHSIDELSSLTTTLSYPQYRNIGFDLKSLSNKENKEERDVQGELMKEIRSIKGSLLSARNFPGTK